MSNRFKQPKRYSKAPNKAVAVFIGLVGLAGVIMMASVAPEIAAVQAGFLLITGFLFWDKHGRSFWEMATDRKVSVLREEQDILARKVREQSQRLNDLKLAIAEQNIQDMEGAAKSIESEVIELQDIHRPVPVSVSEALEADVETEPVPEPAAAPESEQPDFKSTLQDVALFSAPAEKQDFAAIANDDSIFSPSLIKKLLHQSIEAQNIEMFVQPIVSLPQRKTKYYELFARLKAGENSYIPAAQYMETAVNENLNNDIDRLLLVECLRVIRASSYIENATPFFVNVTSSTLRNPAFMNRLLTFISKNKKLAQRLVFEIPQSDYQDLSIPVLEIIRGLGTIGCSFSLGDVKDLSCDIEDMVKHRVRYLKVPSSKLKKAIESEESFVRLQKLKRQFEGNGISFIAERIESERDLVQLFDLDLSLGQGYLFGKPNVQAAYTKTRKAA